MGLPNTTTKTAPSVASAYAALTKLRDNAGTNLNEYLKFSGKSGRYSVKQDNDDKDIDPGTKMAVNMMACRQGYICFKEKAVEDEFMVSLFGGDLPPIESMEDHGPYDEKENEGWKHQFSLMLKDQETGTQYIFNTVSESGRREIGKFINAVVNARGSYPIDQYTPVVELNVQKFTSKKNGQTNYKPVFDIVDWIDHGTVTFVGKTDISDGQQKAIAAPTSVDSQPDSHSDEDAVVVPR